VEETTKNRKIQDSQWRRSYSKLSSQTTAALKGLWVETHRNVGAIFSLHKNKTAVCYVATTDVLIVNASKYVCGLGFVLDPADGELTALSKPPSWIWRGGKIGMERERGEKEGEGGRGREAGRKMRGKIGPPKQKFWLRPCPKPRPPTIKRCATHWLICGCHDVVNWCSSLSL